MSLEVEREEAVQALCAHYAQDHLSTGELEARFELVYKSTTRAQLDTVISGLPALRGLVPVAAPLYQVATPTGTPQGEKRYVAFFSEVKKEGAWTPATMIRSRTVFGSVVFDLREAILPPEGITIDVDVIFGETKVFLPPGLGAEVDASAIMGTVNDKAQRPLPGAPTIRVTGSVLFGEITVVTKLPKAARMESWRKQLKAFFGVAGDDAGTGRLR